MFLSFLLLGALRSLAIVRWRMEQLEATMPVRLGRRGIKNGTKAPDFILPSTDGDEVALESFAGRMVLLVFTQAGCGPCSRIVPELNRLHQDTDFAVLVVNNGDLQSTQKWAGEVGARFPVLAQENFCVSRRYEVFATPFAFLVNEEGVVCSKGIVSERDHIGFVLSYANAKAESGASNASRTGLR